METPVGAALKSRDIKPEIGKVCIVCRFNQARSLLSEHWLSRMYPGLTVSSFGTEADSRIPIPKSVREIALRWGYDLSSASSKNINACSKNDFAETFLIFAEEEFSKSFKAKKWEYGESLSFQSLSLYNDLIPIDPVGLQKSDGTSLEVEIAKALLCTSIAYHLASEKPAPLTKMLFPNDHSALSKTWRLAQEQRPEKAIILDLDFHYNGYSNFQKSSSMVTWDGTLGNMMSSVIPALTESSLSIYYVHPNRESINAEGLILSRQFLESICALTDRFPVIAVCGPLKVIGRQQVATILSLALASSLDRVY